MRHFLFSGKTEVGSRALTLQTLVAIGVSAVVGFAVVVGLCWRRRRHSATRTIMKPMSALSAQIKGTTAAWATVAVPCLAGSTLVLLGYEYYYLPLMVVGMVALVIRMLGIRADRRRIQAKIVAENYLICLSCHYSLQGLPETGLCPECGKEYDPNSLRSRWNALFHDLGLTKGPGESSERSWS